MPAKKKLVVEPDTVVKSQKPVILKSDPPEEEREPCPYDPYKDLRYVQPPYEVPSKRRPRTTKIPVLKPKQGPPEIKHVRSVLASNIPSKSVESYLPKNRSMLSFTLSSIVSASKDRKVYLHHQIDPRASARHGLGPCKSASRSEVPRLALMSRPLPGRILGLLSQQRKLNEAHSLAYYDTVKRSQLQLENYLIKKLDRKRGKLLLRRDQVLPCIEHGGNEKCISRREICETPPPEKPPMVSIFTHNCKANQKRGLLATMSRREKGHNVITEWIGPPHVTDVIMRELGLASTVPMSCFEDCQTKQFVPAFPALAVVGVPYSMTAEGSGMKSAPRAKPPRHKTFATTAAVRQSEGSESEGQSYLRNRENDAKVEKDTVKEGGVVLYFGDNRLSWHDARSSTEKKSCIVEIGGTAEIGNSAMSSTTMRNAGTAVIRYKWVKCDHTDPFGLVRYSKLRFAFDNWGGIILPGETHRVPCLYKARDSGYFSEDWRLITQPVLEGGEPIILRLWGITRHKAVDPRHKEIEEHLKRLIVKSVAEHAVQKFIDFLPLKETPYKDIRFPLIHLGPDLFHLKNPNFHYNSASVFRLSKMVEMCHSINENKDLGQIVYEPLTETSSRDSSYSSDTELPENDSEKMPYESSFEAGKNFGSFVSFGENILMRSVGNISSKLKSYGTTLDPDTLTSSSDRISQEKIRSLIERFINMSDLDHYVLETPSKDLHRRSTRVLYNIEEKTGNESNTRKSVLLQQQKGRKGYVNVVNPDFSVASLRKQIIDVDPLEKVQEALFQIFSDEIAKLSFRPHSPKENWKETVGYTNLSNMLDSFSDFAERLRAECCRGQLFEELSRRREQELLALAEVTTLPSSSFVGEVQRVSKVDSAIEEDKNVSNFKEQVESLPNFNEFNEVNAKLENADEEKSEEKVVEKPMESSLRLPSSSTTALEFFMDLCLNKNPRDILMRDRYQDQYYNRLYCRMYELLGDFLDTIDRLWEEKTEPCVNHDELLFTKIQKIHRGADIEDYLTTPLPPSWIRMAQRMDTVTASNKQRIALSKQ